MISLKVAVLADAANVRDGLLSVIGGGISVIRYPSYPMPLNADVALLFELTEPAEGEQHEIKVDARRVTSEANDETDLLFSVEARLIVGPLGPDAPRHRNAPLAIPLRQAGIPEPGEYRIEVAVNDHPVGNISFAAILREWLPGEEKFGPTDEEGSESADAP